MPMSREVIESRLRSAFPEAEIVLTDLAGDDDHWRLDIASQQFVGLPKVKQHQLVYAALGSDMGTTLHALQLITKVPS